MAPNQDLTAKYEEERIRAHEQSQIVYLQGQIDELRRMIKDQTNKYQWSVEQARKTEAAVGQVEGLFDRHSEEVTQTVEAVRRDVAGLRKEVATAMLKVEEGVRPLREMQAQIQQLADARKQDRDSVVVWFVRIETLEQKMIEIQAQVKESEERHRQLASQLDRLREADTVVAQDVRRVAEDLQIEKQSLRRQAVEAQQLVTDLHQVLADHDARIVRLDEIHQRIELFVERLPGEITAVAEQLPDITGEIKRVERISTERFLMNQERTEDLRRQADEKIDALQEVDDRHLRQLTGWLERIDGWVRELEQRISRATTRLETAQQVHIARIIELERRELEQLQGLSAAFQAQVEATRSGQLEARGEAKQ